MVYLLDLTPILKHLKIKLPIITSQIDLTPIFKEDNEIEIEI
jgi:hypothetical protein